MEQPKLLHLIANLKETAERDDWKVQYNKELDTFYWSRDTISPNTELKQFLDDFSLYINPDGNVEGIFIEYAKFNFFSHNKELEPLIDKLEKGNGENVVSLSKEEELALKPFINSIADKAASGFLKALVDSPALVENLG
ncbi:MAG: hypothetical protein Q8R13_05540 [bacterium]|nr:hypothetical protein [bacterium]MDZ4296458.1 hypothetical protein [Patescibacteria group bacterium]